MICTEAEAIVSFLAHQDGVFRRTASILHTKIGSTITLRKAERKTVLTRGWISTVKEHFDDDPHDPVRKASLFLNVRKTSLV